MLTRLVSVASKVGLYVNTTKTEVLAIPQDLDVVITCEDDTGQIKVLPRCQNFRYLGGWIVDSKKDFLHRRALAWSALNRLKSVWTSPALPDNLRSQLFSATVETVLLYNAETWTLSENLDRELDGCHSHLLRVAFNVIWPQRITNEQLYERAQLTPPSKTLQTRRLKLVGHIVRSEEYCPQPLHKVILWKSKSPYRRGQGSRLSYLDRLLRDINAPETDFSRSVKYIRDKAMSREI